MFDNYRPDHMTPLYDAVGTTLAATEGRVTGDKDGVIFTVMTDGMENASKEYGLEQIVAMIERLKKRGWKFMFLGADIDAYAVGRSLGFAAADTVQLEKGRMRAAFSASRSKTTMYDRARRRFGAKAAEESVGFTDDEKTDMGEKEPPRG